MPPEALASPLRASQETAVIEILRRTHLTDYRVKQGEAQEDQVTAAIEKVTSQVPSSAFLGLALGSMAVSLGLHFSGKKHESLFIGQWAAPLPFVGDL